MAGKCNELRGICTLGKTIIRGSKNEKTRLIEY